MFQLEFLNYNNRLKYILKFLITPSSHNFSLLMYILSLQSVKKANSLKNKYSTSKYTFLRSLDDLRKIFKNLFWIYFWSSSSVIHHYKLNLIWVWKDKKLLLANFLTANSFSFLFSFMLFISKKVFDHIQLSFLYAAI